MHKRFPPASRNDGHSGISGRSPKDTREILVNRLGLVDQPLRRMGAFGAFIPELEARIHRARSEQILHSLDDSLHFTIAVARLVNDLFKRLKTEGPEFERAFFPIFDAKFATLQLDPLNPESVKLAWRLAIRLSYGLWFPAIRAFLGAASISLDSSALVHLSCPNESAGFVRCNIESVSGAKRVVLFLEKAVEGTSVSVHFSGDIRLNFGLWHSHAGANSCPIPSFKDLRACSIGEDYMYMYPHLIISNGGNRLYLNCILAQIAGPKIQEMLVSYGQAERDAELLARGRPNQIGCPTPENWGYIPFQIV